MRLHLASVALCGLRPPLRYSRLLSRLMSDELMHSPAFKRGAAMLDPAETGEQAWRARSLLLL